MLNTVQPIAMQGQAPEGYLARKADNLVDRVAVWARHAHAKMDERNVSFGQNKLNYFA